MRDKPLVFVGLMGVGKTTIGSHIAKKLGLSFFDSDREIEKLMNCSIKEIFQKYGEQYFREKEFEVLQNILKFCDKKSLISAGGGSYIHDKTRSLLQENAYIVWIDANPDEIYNRLKNDNSRPLLMASNPKEVIIDLAKQRNKIYAQSDFYIDTSGKDLGKVILSLQAVIARRVLRSEPTWQSPEAWRVINTPRRLRHKT